MRKLAGWLWDVAAAVVDFAVDASDWVLKVGGVA
jgi:hypothetical protein